MKNITNCRLWLTRSGALETAEELVSLVCTCVMLTFDESEPSGTSVETSQSVGSIEATETIEKPEGVAVAVETSGMIGAIGPIGSTNSIFNARNTSSRFIGPLVPAALIDDDEKLRIRIAFGTIGTIGKFKESLR